MPHSQCEVMRRAFHTPVLDESANVRWEAAARVSVARRRYRAGERLALSNDEFESALVSLRQSHAGDRAIFQLKFHTYPGAAFSMIDAQAAQHRTTFSYSDVMRAVMTD